MYRQHFGLKAKPFSLIPDPSFLHFSDKHKVAYSLLEYGLHEQSGLTVITGEVGSGKTTLIRHLLSEIDQSELAIGLINNTHASLGDLTQWVALAFGIAHEDKDKVTLFRDVQDYLINEWANGKRAVLIVDEAQNMDKETLEELRLYTNINADGEQFLQIVLVGQPELRDILRAPELAQMAQRVSVEYHIEPLGWQDTANYIRHRLATASNEESVDAASHIFDSVAIAVIFYFSGGVPRLINTLCDFALVHAYAMGLQTINHSIALEVIRGRTIGGVNRFTNNEEQLKLVRERVLDAVGLDLASALEDYKPSTPKSAELTDDTVL
ncbi:MAG TPA: general secretion pathway protein [Cellvibrionales bacterium]|jgi:type II secretory pathway predicted ATPase ExeA|nr:AAA family ATPase [Pseudomonadales bacterium]HAB54854.1 general secretion pathway protein [Cellvibrionales bacterium]HCX26728.1 general secretion pathway protein [Cellvibrionales bacterium]